MQRTLNRIHLAIRFCNAFCERAVQWDNITCYF